MTVQKSKRVATIDEVYCVGCGSCIKVCPKDAISVPRGVVAQVDMEKCVGCGLCAKMCPASVIEIVKTVIENKEIFEYEK
jgi:ferredoxin